MMTINFKIVPILVLTAAAAVSMAQNTARSDGAKKSDDVRPMEGRPSLESEIEELRQKN